MKIGSNLVVYNLHLFDRLLVKLQNSAVEVANRRTDTLTATHTHTHTTNHFGCRRFELFKSERPIFCKNEDCITVEHSFLSEFFMFYYCVLHLASFLPEKHTIWLYDNCIHSKRVVINTICQIKQTSVECLEQLCWFLKKTFLHR